MVDKIKNIITLIFKTANDLATIKIAKYGKIFPCFSNAVIN